MWQKMLQIGSGGEGGGGGWPYYYWEKVYANIKQYFNNNKIDNSYTVEKSGYYVVFSAFGHFNAGSPEIECSTATKIFNQDVEATPESYRSARITQFKCKAGDIITVTNPAGTVANSTPSSFSTIIFRVNFKISKLLLFDIKGENAGYSKALTTTNKTFCIAFSCGNGTTGTSLTGAEMNVIRDTFYSIGTMEASNITIATSGSGAWTVNVMFVGEITEV